MPITHGQLRTAIDRVRAARERMTARVATIRAAGDRLGELIDAEAQPARRALESAVVRWRAVGVVPSFVRLAGLGDREKPFNRLIGWWTRDADHGAGWSFLRAMCAAVGLPELVADLDRGDVPEIHVESGFDAEPRKQPDLVVITSRAALMVENKVHAGESGDQYSPYLHHFRRLADKRQQRTALLARDSREKPVGWSMAMTHAEVALMFRGIAARIELPYWARVAAMVTASAFEDQESPEEKLREANAVLARTKTGRISPRDLRIMRGLTFDGAPLTLEESAR